MPFTLLHGPPGGGKTGKIIDDIARKYLEKPDTFFLVLPNSHAGEKITRQLLRKSGQQALLTGESITTFDQFFFHLLKINLPRVHLASALFSRHVIRSLLFENDYPSFKESRFFLKTVSSLQQAFVQFKKNGLNPDKAKILLDPYRTEESDDMLCLFGDYQIQLRKLGFFDKGDLVLETLSLLHEGRLKLPPTLEAIFVDRFMPLSLGQREFLAVLTKKFPELAVTVAYSFDYSAEDDPYFYPAYSLLGECSTHAEYFPQKKKSKNKTVLSFPDPSSEIEWIAENIRQELQKGLKPDEIAVILPPYPFYHRRLSRLLNEKNIPHHPAPSFPLSRLAQTGDPEKLIAPFLHEKLSSLRDLLSGLHAADEFEKRWNFETGLVFPNSPEHERLNQWKEEELRHVRITGPSIAEGVALHSLDEASFHDYSVLFVAGYSENHYPPRNGEHPFFTPELLIHPATREILEGPEYVRRLAFHQLAEACARAGKKCVFSFSKTLWNGQEQFLSRLLPVEEGCPLEDISFEKERDLKKEPLSFSRLKFSTFSISQLQDYQDCPFKYYARRHLNLGKLEEEDVDIAPDKRGSFVHRVLERLIRENEALYREAVEYDLYLDKLKECVDRLVSEEKLTYLAGAPRAVLESFAQRAKEAIGATVTEEIMALRAGVKKTFPRYYEWAFGKGTVPFLKIGLKDRFISISGRIDRIDTNDKEKIFSLADYKSGKTPSLTEIKNGDSLQLPLYIMAVAELLLADFKWTGAYLVNLADLKNTGLVMKDSPEEARLSKTYGISNEEWEDLKKRVVEKVRNIAASIEAGNFAPNPREKNQCRYCDYRDVCHFEGKDSDP